MTDTASLMTDKYSRRITDVRIALNSVCNLHCIYCHHEGELINGCERYERSAGVSAEEIAEILQVLGDLGVQTVKLTGGEPTLREDITDIIRSVPGGIEVSMTTNGTRLKNLAGELKKAGLSRVNISIDSLRRDRYAAITGRDLLSDVLEGLTAAREAGLTPIKINTVLLPGINDDEIADFLALVRGQDDLILQFIELMDMNGWTDTLQNGTENAGFVSSLEERFRTEAEIVETRRMHHRRKYNLNGAVVEIVRPMHNPEFCANCNRIRITSDGKLKPCLLRTGNEVSIRGLHGDELIAAVAQAVSNRSPYFTEEV